VKIHARHHKLIEIVRKKETASVEDLAALLGTSRETIRRDLTHLSRAGMIQKIHGGATIPRALGEGAFRQRMSENVEAKITIANLAAGLFKPGETLLIDTGSTTLFLAEALSAIPHLTVVTNAAEIARTIASCNNGSKVFLLGGEFSAENAQTVGTMVAAQIRSFRAHHAILTVGALDARSGAMDYNIDEAQVARAMIAQCERVTVLADASKFNAVASFEVCPLEAIDMLVSDSPPPEDIAQALVASGAKVVLPPRNSAM